MVLICSRHSGAVTTGRTAAAVLGGLLCLPGAASGQAGATADAIGVALAGSGPLTLAEALARARAYSPAIRAADAHATSGAAVADASRRWQGPRLDLSVENLGVRGLDRDGFAWITQPLDIGPRRSTRVAAARASQQWLAATADARRRETDVAVIDAYLTLVEVQQTAALLAGHESTIDEAVQVMAHRVREGVAPEGDLRKLEAEAARTRLARVRSELALRQSSLALGVLIGRVDSTLGQHVVLPALPPLDDGHADLASAVDRRADIRTAVARVEERRALASAERAAGSAAFAAMAGYKRTSGFNTATAGVSIDLPIGARNATDRLRADADASAAAFDLEQARAAARADIEGALLAMQVLAEEARRVDDTLVAPAVDARRAARAAFREGTGDALTLVDADRVYLDTQRDALAVRLDAVTASIRARVALGWDPLP